jgi:hypothetical protein
MFHRFVHRNRRQVNRKSDPLKGFQNLGLGDPNTLWFAEDQDPGLATFVTRFGFPWSKNEQDGGSLDLSTAVWGVGSLPTVDWIDPGANVRLGLRCDQMGTSGVPVRDVRWTIAHPIYFPATFTPVIYDWCFQGGATDNNLWRTFWNAVSPGNSLEANGGNILTTSAWLPANTLDPRVYRRGIVVATMAMNSPTSAFTTYLARFSGGQYLSLGRSTSSVNVGDWSRFALGYVPRLTAAGASSSKLSYGGAVGWKAGATTSQMNAIADLWETLYPLS